MPREHGSLKMFMVFFWRSHAMQSCSIWTQKSIISDRGGLQTRALTLLILISASLDCLDEFILNTRIDSQMAPTSFSWGPVDLCQPTLTPYLQGSLIGRIQIFWEVQIIKSSTKLGGWKGGQWAERFQKPIHGPLLWKNTGHSQNKTHVCVPTA